MRAIATITCAVIMAVLAFTPGFAADKKQSVSGSGTGMHHHGKGHGHGGGHGGGMGHHAFLDAVQSLDLKPDQKTKVEELAKKHMDAITPKKDLMEKAWDALDKALNADKPVEADIRAAHQKISVIKEDMMVERANFTAAVKGILTPDQKTALDKKLADSKDGSGMSMGKGHKCEGSDKKDDSSTAPMSTDSKK